MCKGETGILKFLIAEDDRQLRHLFAHALIKNGFELRKEEIDHKRADFSFFNNC